MDCDYSSASYLQLAELGTAEILNTPGFIKDAKRDAGHPLRNGETVSEVQGCQELCQKVVEVTSKYPHALSLYNLRNQREINIPLSDRIRQKWACHVFNLMNFSLLNGQFVTLEGFNESFTLPMLQVVFMDFARENPDLISDSLKTKISQPFASAIWNDNATDEKIKEACRKIKDPNCDEFILVGSGYDWHLTIFIFFKGYIFYCDRGAQIYKKNGSGMAGWNVFKIGNLENMTPELLEQLVRRMSYSADNCLSINKLIAELQATWMFWGKMCSQKIGNCTFANGKGALSCLFTILEYEKNNDFKEFNVDTFKKAFESATKFLYKPFMLYTTRMACEDTLIGLEQPGFSQATIIAQLLYNKFIGHACLPVFGYKVGWARMSRLNVALNDLLDPSFTSKNSVFSTYVSLNCKEESQESIFKHLILSIENKQVPGFWSDCTKKLVRYFSQLGVTSFDQRLKICSLLLSKNQAVGETLTSNFEKLGFIEDLQSCENDIERIEKAIQIASLGKWALSSFSTYLKILNLKFNDFQFFLRLAKTLPEPTLDFFLACLDHGILSFSDETLNSLSQFFMPLPAPLVDKLARNFHKLDSQISQKMRTSLLNLIVLIRPSAIGPLLNNFKKFGRIENLKLFSNCDLDIDIDQSAPQPLSRVMEEIESVQKILDFGKISETLDLDSWFKSIDLVVDPTKKLNKSVEARKYLTRHVEKYLKETPNLQSVLTLYFQMPKKAFTRICELESLHTLKFYMPPGCYFSTLKLNQLRVLEIHFATLQSSELKKLSELESLTLSFCNLDILEIPLKLGHLSLSDCVFEKFPSIQKFKNLKTLKLKDCQIKNMKEHYISQTFLPHLKKSFPKVKILD